MLPLSANNNLPKSTIGWIKFPSQGQRKTLLEILQTEVNTQLLSDACRNNFTLFSKISRTP